MPNEAELTSALAHLLEEMRTARLALRDTADRVELYLLDRDTDWDVQPWAMN